MIIDINVARNDIVYDSREECFWFIFHNGTIDGDFSHLWCPAQNHTEGILYHMECDIVCSDPFINEVITGATDGNVKASSHFWMFVTMLSISWAGMAVVVSIGDAICIGMIANKQTNYGYQRVWGSVGWGSFTFITGVLIDYFSKDKTSTDYSIGFYLMAGLIVLDLLVSSKLNYTQANRSGTMMRDLITMSTSIRVIVFFMWCVAAGLCCAMVWNFLFWHIEEMSGCDQDYMTTLQGLLTLVQCFIGEVPFFFFSGWLLQKIGHVHAMSLVLLGYAGNLITIIGFASRIYQFSYCLQLVFWLIL